MSSRAQGRRVPFTRLGSPAPAGGSPGARDAPPLSPTPPGGQLQGGTRGPARTASDKRVWHHIPGQDPQPLDALQRAAASAGGGLLLVLYLSLFATNYVMMMVASRSDYSLLVTVAPPLHCDFCLGAPEPQ